MHQHTPPQDDGSSITVEPGLIAAEVNKILAKHKTKHNLPIQYKIGPDPSSIDSCMIGGVVANNSSGMCCGVSQNTYHTLKDMRVVFVDGTVLDTSDAESRQRFLQVWSVCGGLCIGGLHVYIGACGCVHWWAAYGCVSLV